MTWWALLPILALLLVAPAAAASGTASNPEDATPASTGGHQTPHGPSDLAWQPQWRRFGVADGVATAAGLGLAITAVAVGPDTRTPRTFDVPLDEAIRDRLRPESLFARQNARDVSDQLRAIGVSYPFFVDALVLAYWRHRKPDVAGQLALLDVEALSLTLGVQQAFANFISRERPYGRECGTEQVPEQTAACALPDRYRSYFSGHTSVSFTAASLTCTHHWFLRLQGGHAEWLPCATLLGVASATGTLRIVGDRHYFTDVVTGAGVGGFIGWLVPWLHYRGTRHAQRMGVTSSRLQWIVVPTPGGVGVVGVF